MEFFPSVHQVSDPPHERLVPIDGRLRRTAVGVETGLGHLLFQLSDLYFGLGDLRLQCLDLRTPRVFGARFPPGVRVDPLSFVAGGLFWRMTYT